MEGSSMKSRHSIKAASVMIGAIAVAATLTTSASTALAKAAAPRCTSGQLAMAVPTATAGDPAEGMGKLAWNVFLRNTGQESCSLAGWPGLLISTGAKQAAITSTDVSYSNLAEVRAQAFTLAAGRQAVVTVQMGSNTSGCRSDWELTLRLPGGGGALTSNQPANAFGPCGSKQLNVSPLYPRSALTKAVKNMAVSQSPPVYRTSDARVPAA